MYRLVEQAEREASTVLQKNYPEQSILVFLEVLQILDRRFPRSVRLHFRKKQYRGLKDKFFEWQSACAEQIPDSYRNELVVRAEKLFAELDSAYEIKST